VRSISEEALESKVGSTYDDVDDVSVGSIVWDVGELGLDALVLEEGCSLAVRVGEGTVRLHFRLHIGNCDEESEKKISVNDFRVSKQMETHSESQRSWPRLRSSLAHP
jgi:hypothetical protein